VLASLVSENASHVLQATSVVQVRQMVSKPLHMFLSEPIVSAQRLWLPAILASLLSFVLLLDFLGLLPLMHLLCA
jgi:hypothetical protein